MQSTCPNSSRLNQVSFPKYLSLRRETRKHPAWSFRWIVYYFPDSLGYGQQFLVQRPGPNNRSESLKKLLSPLSSPQRHHVILRTENNPSQQVPPRLTETQVYKKQSAIGELTACSKDFSGPSLKIKQRQNHLNKKIDRRLTIGWGLKFHPK